MIDRFLDDVWSMVAPIAGKCAVCAFFRGLAIGLTVAFIVHLCHLL